MLSYNFGLAAEVVKGLVKDESGEPLPGSTVLIKGTNTYAAADVNGEFQIGVPNKFHLP